MIAKGLRLTLQDPAYQGLAGEILRLIEPHTEADPAGLLLQLLTMFGNAIGPKAHFLIEAEKHKMILYAVLAGESSKARKGTSLKQIFRLFEAVDPDWSAKCVSTGLSSGEGIIHRLRDPSEILKHGKVESDPGIEDKRLLVIEGELASVLKHMQRQGNTLSPILRQAWDASTLSALTKNCPSIASDPHLSLIGHTTIAELIRSLTSTEAANGFGNRFLWALVHRTKSLPEGGSLHPEDFAETIITLRQAVAFGKNGGELKFDEEARELWYDQYDGLSEGRAGLFGSMTARAEAQVRRISAIYALMDLSLTIRIEHLWAALALWEYCENSCRIIFGSSLGDDVADQIICKLKEVPEGMNRTGIRDLFHRNKSEIIITKALDLLRDCGLARLAITPTLGRPEERWFAVNSNDLNDERASQ